jgi:cell division protein FtsL
MDNNLVPIVLFIGIFATAISAIYYNNRRKERLTLIASGKDASIFGEPEKRKSSWSSLKYGMLAVGIGIGAIVGEIISSYTQMNVQTAYFSMILIFGGSALLIHHVIESKNK